MNWDVRELDGFCLFLMVVKRNHKTFHIHLLLSSLALYKIMNILGHVGRRHTPSIFFTQLTSRVGREFTLHFQRFFWFLPRLSLSLCHSLHLRLARPGCLLAGRPRLWGHIENCWPSDANTEGNPQANPRRPWEALKALTAAKGRASGADGSRPRYADHTRPLRAPASLPENPTLRTAPIPEYSPAALAAATFNTRAILGSIC